MLSDHLAEQQGVRILAACLTDLQKADHAARWISLVANARKFAFDMG